MRLTLEAIAIVVLVTLAVPAEAQTLRVTATTTNLRAQPAADSAIVAPLALGAELDVVGQEGTWYRVRVRSSGAEGFVHSLVVEAIAGSSPATAPAPSSPAPRSQPPSQAFPQPASTRPTPQPAQSFGSVERNYLIRPFGGLWSGAGTTGFGLGAGLATRPFDNDQIEVSVDFAYARQRVNRIVVGGAAFTGDDIFDLGSRLFQGSGNLLYNFTLSSESFTPFAGIGLQYGNQAYIFTADYSTSDRRFIERAIVGFDGLSLQALVGIEKPINDSRAWRAELRGTRHGVLLLGGLSF